MNHFERNCPKATALAQELGLGKIHYRDRVYWADNGLQLTYLQDKDGEIGKDWTRHEAHALSILNKIKTARKNAGTLKQRLSRLYNALKEFLPQAKLERTGFWHLTPDQSGDEVCVLCGHGISRMPGVSSIWVRLWDRTEKLELHRDTRGSEHERVKFPHHAADKEILAAVKAEMEKIT